MKAMLYAASHIPRLTMDGLFQLLRKSARFLSTLIAASLSLLVETGVCNAMKNAPDLSYSPFYVCLYFSSSRVVLSTVWLLATRSLQFLVSVFYLHCFSRTA